MEEEVIVVFLLSFFFFFKNISESIASLEGR